MSEDDPAEAGGRLHPDNRWLSVGEVAGGACGKWGGVVVAGLVNLIMTKVLEVTALLLVLMAWLSFALDLSVTGYFVVQIATAIVAGPLTSVAARGKWL